MSTQLPIELRFVTLPSGLTLEYAEQGNPDGTPVVFLHGYADSWQSFSRVLPHLPTHIRALALTQRGHGSSGRPLTGYHPGDFAADAVAVMEALEISRAVLVGHSSACIVIQHLALDHPERIAGMVLTGAPCFPLRDNPAAVDLLNNVLSTLGDPVDPDLVRSFWQGAVGSAVPSEFIEANVGESVKMPARVWRTTWEGLMEAGPPQWEAISAPTLIVWGDLDQITPRSEQTSLAAAVRGSRLSIYQGVGHSPHVEDPERFAAELVTFVHDITG